MLTAIVVAVAAVLAPPVPTLAAALFVLLALATRRPMVLAIALALLVGARAHGEDAALASAAPARLDGVAELASDPQQRSFDVQVVLRIDGRRYLATVPLGRAGELPRLLTGERVRVSGTTSALDGAPRAWVRSRHLAARLSVRHLEPLGSSAPWYRIANRVHRTLSDGASPFERDRRALYLGLVIGDDREQSDLMEHRFRSSGLTHLLAVSGSNVAFVLAAAAPLLVRLRPGPRAAVSLALLIVFLLVTRADPSVLRATTMAAIAIIATTTGRLASGARVLSLAVVGLLVVDPLLIHSLGFQLSVCATGGLLVGSRPIMQRLPGPEWVTAPLAVTIAAQLATAPLLLAFTGSVPAVATVANLLAGPAAGAVMMLGVTVGALAGLVREPFASALQLPNQALVWWIDQVSVHSTSVPLAPLTPPRLGWLLAAVALALIAGRRWQLRPLLRRAAGLGVMAAVALWPQGHEPGRHELSRSAVLWVGSCGATVLHLDGGGRALRVLEELSARGIRRLDVVVLGGSRSLDTLAQLREAVEVRRVIAQRDPVDGHDALAPGARVDLGGVVLSRDPVEGSEPPSVELGLSGTPCSLTP